MHMGLGGPDFAMALRGCTALPGAVWLLEGLLMRAVSAINAWPAVLPLPAACEALCASSLVGLPHTMLLPLEIVGLEQADVMIACAVLLYMCTAFLPDFLAVNCIKIG